MELSIATAFSSVFLTVLSFSIFVSQTDCRPSLLVIKNIRLPSLLQCGDEIPEVRVFHDTLFALHGEEKFLVGLGVLELVDEEFDGRQILHAVQQFAQNPHALQLVFAG